MYAPFAKKIAWVCLIYVSYANQKILVIAHYYDIHSNKNKKRRITPMDKNCVSWTACLKKRTIYDNKKIILNSL